MKKRYCPKCEKEIHPKPNAKDLLSCPLCKHEFERYVKVPSFSGKGSVSVKVSTNLE